MASLVRLRSLGQCAFDVGPVQITHDAKMRFAMLLFLAIERGKQIPRSALADMLWPGVATHRARHSLRHLTYVLRTLGIPVADGASLVELPVECVDLDYESALATDAVPDEGYPEFLPGYAPTFSSAFSEWVDAQRSHVHGRFRVRLLLNLAARRLTGRWSDVERAARNCLRFDPLNEEATLALAEATALNGSKASAVAILDHFIAELNTGPRDIRIPASVLRRRIAERLTSPYSASAEACFVGRDDIVASLTTQLRRLRQSRGSSCLMWGPAGIGKSRVALEATRVATLEGVRVSRTVCQSSDTRRPLSVFADLVPSLLDLPGSLGCSPVSRQYLTRLTQFDAPAPQDGEALATTPIDAAFTHARVGHAILDLIDSVCDEAPLLIVVENVHWTDTISAEILRELVDRGERRALLTILTSRRLPPPGSPLHGFVHGLTVCELGPITDDESRHLFLSVTTGCDRVPDEPCLNRNITLGEGNPFFVRELAAHWATAGDAAVLPSSLTAAIRERLDQLDSAAMHVLQVCALLGKNSTCARLDHILAYPQFQLIDCLQALDDQGLLSTIGNQLRVKHELLADTALARLSPAAKRFLHRRIGTTLETDIGLEQSGILWDCARHLQEAGEHAKALVVLRRCARQSLELGSPPFAVEILDHAHAFCETDDERIQLRNDLILALRAAGLWTRIVELHRDVDPTAPATSTPARGDSSVHASTYARTYASVHDDVELAGLEARWEVDRTIPPILERALVCLHAEHAAPGHRVRAGIWALILAHNIPDADVAEDVYRTLGDITSGTQVSDIDRMTADLIYQTGFGDLRRGADAGARLVAATRASGDLASLSRVLRFASVPLLYLGRFGEVRGLLCEGLEMLERRRLRWGTYITTACFVRSYFEEGDLESASHWYQRLRRLSDSSDDLASTCHAHLLGAKIALVEHRYEAPELLDFPPLSRWETIASARAQSIAMAVWSLSTLRRGLTVEHAELIDRFRRMFDRAKYSGNQDFPAFALFEALRARGDELLASTILRRYIDRERRERSPLPPFLALAFGSLPTG
jgi:DNA-binding SARP family transcriptional activator